LAVYKKIRFEIRRTSIEKLCFFFSSAVKPRSCFFPRLMPAPRYRHHNYTQKPNKLNIIGLKFRLILFITNISPGWLKTWARFSYTLCSPYTPLNGKALPTRPLTAHLAPVLYYSTGRSSTGIAFVTVRKGRGILGFFYFFRSSSPPSFSYTHTYPIRLVKMPQLNLLIYMPAHFLFSHLCFIYYVHNKYMSSESGIINFRHFKC